MQLLLLKHDINGNLLQAALWIIFTCVLKGSLLASFRICAAPLELDIMKGDFQL